MSTLFIIIYTYIWHTHHFTVVAKVTRFICKQTVTLTFLRFSSHLTFVTKLISNIKWFIPELTESTTDVDLKHRINVSDTLYRRHTVRYDKNAWFYRIAWTTIFLPAKFCCKKTLSKVKLTVVLPAYNYNLLSLAQKAIITARQQDNKITRFLVPSFLPCSTN